MLLILASIKEQTNDDAAECSRFLHGVRGRLTSARKHRKVVALREVVPEMELAESGAQSAVGTLCLICPRREKCPDPLA
ncbi:MAG: hypothetical protein ACM3W4_01590 [Ignavibacteriales bacterium]